jgi:hypothetical protein
VSHSVETLLVQKEISLLDPQIRKSDVLSKLLADDFIEVGSSGRCFDKTEVIQALQIESTEKFDASDFRVRFLAEGVALVTYIVVRSNGLASSSFRSSLWVQKSGDWQMVFHQGTPIVRKTSA